MKILKKSRTTLSATLAFMMMATTMTAQIDDPAKEIGITGRGLSGWGIIYKKQKAENKYFRIRTARVNFNVTGADTITNANATLGLAIGMEKRKSIEKNLEILSGWEVLPSVGYAHETHLRQSKRSLYDLNLGVGILLGARYSFNESFALSLEWVPNITPGLHYEEPFIGRNNITEPSRFYWTLDGNASLDTFNMVLVYRL